MAWTQHTNNMHLPICNKFVFLLTLAAIVAANVMFSYGQSTAFGARATVALVQSVAVENPSPSNIHGPQDLAINAGIYALRYFKAGRMGGKGRT